ncbi:DNRLRE domain-containing protein [Oceanihabitans sp. 2_MG-2023]|uniref:CBM96 family carbohydrate-binding protein n=1 Tax=Oceanihabitans sp. 2_MG-2023 TaxID=3062661 RepID=UPI0026E1C781|nr:DNRLRE domain-containing protein [Oceanihabitans sp. 2_MG-2023]MDO6598096.1 DNRLRE domain-containing protein [Oceanihabitans sp. 2_MG-2023]
MKIISLKSFLFLLFILQSVLSFSQTTIIASADSYTWNTNPGVNYGTKRLIISADTDNTSHVRHSYLKFNIASLPSVTSAKLRLTLESSPAVTRNYTAFLVNDSWSNGGIKWNNAPAVVGASLTTTNNVGNVIEFDLTTVVSDHITNGDTVISIKLVSNQEDLASFIYSTDTAASNADKPRLVINDPTLSLENEIESDVNNIAVYPNPTTNTIFLKGLSTEGTTVYIYNTLGQLLKQEIYNENVDLSAFEAGVYYVKVLNGMQQKTFSMLKK